MEWSRSDIEHLLELYKRQPCLWDPGDPHYKNRGRKAEAWAAIAGALGAERAEVRRKMESLLACFRRERILQERGGPRPRGGSWVHFQSMAFLLDRWKNAPGAVAATVPDDSADVTIKEEYREDSSDLFITLQQTSEDPLCASSVFTEEDSIVLEPDIPLEDYSEETLKRRRSEEESDVDEVLKVLRGSGAISLGRDECTVFGEFVACKLRGYSPQARNMAQHLISNVLFDADTGKYDKTATVALQADSSQLLR